MQAPNSTPRGKAANIEKSPAKEVPKSPAKKADATISKASPTLKSAVVKPIGLGAGNGAFKGKGKGMGKTILNEPVIESVAGVAGGRLGQSVKAGLQFSVPRVARFMKQGRYADRIGGGAPIYLTSAL